jgi:putative hydrolase
LEVSLKRDYHVHANYNDHSASDLTIQNVIREAEKKGLQTLAFTEHVRKSSDWISRYLDEIESTKARLGNSLELITGFEAKILRDGSIDCPERYASEYFLVSSFHTRYTEKHVWLGALERAIENPSVDVIGHLAPEPSFSLERSEIEDLANLIVKNEKIIELNAKYHRPPAEWLVTFKQAGVKFHLGSDAHSLPEVGDFQSLRELITLIS